jgi:chromosome segregation protein
MHLRSLTLKGFKSFPDRTRLEFSPGVSVIVGPNGSGKSNVSEAVLWALGEQSPSAVRGQTMQDVIFAGGQGRGSSGGAEVEVVLDNSDGAAEPGGFSEVSIARHLDRSSESGYRLNGARCRLVDVAEVLSDTGLGREMHSVVSQGRVEAIVHSRPRERRLLIEEAAGLGKHRRRRRRAELKLGHTRDNLDRALDVEREARSGLRPLKRQAEAAELHARLERGMLEARLELVREDGRAAEAERAAAEEATAAARAERDEAERGLDEVGRRREAAERAFAEHVRAREELSGRVHAARSVQERIGLRAERARETARGAAEGAQRRRADLERLEREIREAGAESPAGDSAARIEAFEAELAELSARDGERRAEEIAELEAEREEAERARVQASRQVEELRAALSERERAAETARAERGDAERAAEVARTRAAAAGAELASANAFLRTAAGGPGGGGRPLLEDLDVEPGYELALAAALGPRLRAEVVEDLAAGEAVLERAGPDGASALVAGGESGSAGTGAGGEPPAPGAERLLDRVSPTPGRGALAARLLGEVWVVDRLSDLPADFAGVAVTRGGRVLDGRLGELRQAPTGGEERVLEERNRRERLVAASEQAATAEVEARAGAERARERVAAADREREGAESSLRSAARDADEAAETVRRLAERARRRSEYPAEGPGAVRRAELEAELRAERRLAERAEHERAERAGRRARLAGRIERDAALATAAERAAAALAAAEAAVAARRSAFADELQAGAALGERTAAELRECAREEAALQVRLRAAAEILTAAEVRAERARDRAAERAQELAGILARLGQEAEAAVSPSEPLSSERRAELEAQLERLARRRETLGPVNPLAEEAYAEALAHVEELEAQRQDLETALSELETLIRDIDRRIRESFESTFAAAASNFEELAAHLFPGGRGRLRLVRPDGGGPEAAAPEEPDDESAATESEAETAREEPGVEVEVTPAGKATRRLSLLSGGEKSLVAIAFLFAVFLARPCPFYILDEVEAALDDLNIDRFLELLRRYSDRAQFIVVTHQKRTMDAADRVYGVSMSSDGVSKVVSRRLRGRSEGEESGAVDAKAA